MPIITMTLKQMVVGFQFAGFGPDDLTSGCQPFPVSYSGSAQHHYTALAAAKVENQELSQCKQSASVSDYRSICEKEKVVFLRDVSSGLCITLNHLADLSQSLFQGVGLLSHPFVKTMWAAVMHGCSELCPV